MARRTPSTGPGPSPFPLRSSAAPALPSSAGRLPLPPPVPSFGGFSFPRQQQQPKTMATPPSSVYNSALFIQHQQRQSPALELAVGGISGGGGGGGGGSAGNDNRAANAVTESPNVAEMPASSALPSRRPTSAASQGTSRKVNSGGGTTGMGRKRELASLLGSSPAFHHHIGSTPLPTTMPVSGGDRPPGSDDDLTFEVTRFGRPRVAPLAYWSSERLLVGTKAAGAQGIHKGSTSGDLLASAGATKKVAKKLRPSIGGSGGSNAGNKKKQEEMVDVVERGMKRNDKVTTTTTTTSIAAGEDKELEPEKRAVAPTDEDNALEAPVAGRRGGRGRDKRVGTRGGRGRGRGRGKSTIITTGRGAVEEERKNEALVGATREDDDKYEFLEEKEENALHRAVPSPRGGGIASLAVAAGAKASAAAAAAAATKKKKPTKIAAKPPAPVAHPSYASPSHAANTTTTPESKTLPEVKGVPATTVAALAATPPAQRPKRCGECPSCLKPSRKQACQTLRALGANPPLSRVSHKKKQQQKSRTPAAGGAAKDGKVVKNKKIRKRSPSPNLPPAAALQDSEETIIEKQQNQQQQQGKKRRTFRKRKAGETSSDTTATGTTAGPVRRSTRQRSASVEVTGNGEPSTLLDTATKGTASVGPPSSQNLINTTAAAGDGGAGGDVSAAWTAEQVASLHRGWLEVAPNAKNFWQKVAAMVPGRSANECFNKMYEKHPTPPAKKITAAGAAGGGRKLLAAVRGGNKEAPEQPIKVGGTSKQAVQNAVRKVARQQRLQQRAEEIAATGTGGVGGNKEGVTLEISEEQQHRDKYIDQILRKRRGRALGMAPRRAPRPPAAVAVSGGAASGGGGGFRAGASGVAREVTAALAASKEDEPDRDSGEESDYYWSDAE